MEESLNFKVTYDFIHIDSSQQLLNELYKYNNDLCTKILHRKRINLVYDTITKLKKSKVINSNSKALDIGCNCGFYAKLLSDMGFSKVHGIDISPNAIKLANERFAMNNSGKEISFQLIDATQLNLEDKYDFILCTEVIEHTDKPNNVIESIHNLLTDDGIAIISIPNRMSLNYSMAIVLKKILRKPFTEDFVSHIQYPFYKTIKLFKRKNFKIIHITGTNFFLLDNFMRIIAKSPTLIRFDSWLSKLFPFKYFTQFFFLIVKKDKLSK